MITNTKLVFFMLAFMALAACSTNRAFAPEKGLFKVSVLYPSGDNKTFDMDYYETKHMPLVAGFLGKNLQFYEINKGISGRTTNDKAPFLAIGSFYVRDIAAYNTSISANRDSIINDIKKYTNIQPVILVSEVRKVAK